MEWPAFTAEIGTTLGLVPDAWDDETDLVLSPGLDHSYGRPDELAQSETGTASFRLDNATGKWQPGIDPNTAVRVTAVHDATTHPIVYGLIESAPAIFPGQGTDAFVDVDLADGMTLLARHDRDGVTRPRELTGTRIAALLDLAGWPAGLRDIDPGLIYVDAVEDETLNVLSAIHDAVESEQGMCFVAPDGSFTFRDRHARLDVDADLVLSGPAGDGVMFEDLEPKYDDATLWTVARVELADGRVFEWVDDDAADPDTGYGERVYPIRDLGIRDAEAEMLAAWMVIRYAHPMRRFDTLDIQAVNDASIAALLSLRPGALLHIKAGLSVGVEGRRILDEGGDPILDEAGDPILDEGGSIDQQVHVERISHRIGDRTWRATLHLSPYFGKGPWLVWDDPDRGWDMGAKWAP